MTDYQMVMRAGPNPGKVFLLDQDEMVVGREPGVEIEITDPSISRKHARLRKQEDGYYEVEDLGSTNGTAVNDKRIVVGHLLMAGDTVRFGENILLVVEEVPTVDPNATVVKPLSMPLEPSVEPGEAILVPPMAEPVEEVSVPEPVEEKVPVSESIPDPSPMVFDSVTEEKPSIPPAAEPVKPSFVDVPVPPPHAPMPPVEPPKKKGMNPWIIVLIVVLVLLCLCVVLVVGAYAIFSNSSSSLLEPINSLAMLAIF